jgi:hypothetical protein
MRLSCEKRDSLIRPTSQSSKWLIPLDNPVRDTKRASSGHVLSARVGIAAADRPKVRHSPADSCRAARFIVVLRRHLDFSLPRHFCRPEFGRPARTSPGFTPYGGSKGFLHAFMKGVALEQAPYGVRANCICPGPVDTAWTRGADSPIDLWGQEVIDAMVPLGRRGTPEEIANIFAFLASDDASYVTGALWLADGGITPAKSDIGAHVRADLRRAPDGVLKLKHSYDGLRGKEVYRAAERKLPGIFGVSH